MHAASVDKIPGPPDCDITANEFEAQKRLPAVWLEKFPEVISIWNRGFTYYTDKNEQELCSGTAISDSLILTAAHCFLGNWSTASINRSGGDYVHQLTPADDVVVRAGAALILDSADRERRPIELIVHGGYGGAPSYIDDLALLRLGRPFPENAMVPAQLGDQNQFNPTITIAGYGYSDTDPKSPTAGSLNASWPGPVKPIAEGKMCFDPTRTFLGHLQEFCPGDSGGPVFAGRYRGCSPTDRAHEPKPHLLMGVVSYFLPRDSAEKGSTLFKCEHAAAEVMQDITTPEHRAWICRYDTARKVKGCDWGASSPSMAIVR